jgi:hypothetical protein
VPTDEPPQSWASSSSPSQFVNLTKFNEDGYVLVDGVFSPEEVDELHRGVRQQVLTEASQYVIRAGTDIPDFMARPSFGFMHHLPTKPKLLSALQQAFGREKFRYCNHNGIGVNRIVGWHKDRLNDAYRKYQKLPLWGDQPDGWPTRLSRSRCTCRTTRTTPTRSFNTPSMATDGLRRLHPRKGQVIIFEHERSTHRGGFGGRKKRPVEGGPKAFFKPSSRPVRERTTRGRAHSRKPRLRPRQQLLTPASSRPARWRQSPGNTAIQSIQQYSNTAKAPQNCCITLV